MNRLPSAMIASIYIDCPLVGLVSTQAHLEIFRDDVRVKWLLPRVGVERAASAASDMRCTLAQVTFVTMVLKV